ncbi:ABC transporter substrate-binding protein [Paenibacillus glycinis]|uniref:Extracellular solute-binding protein n=1 Tax=Paenibacillus glycinis TaxID=2697035 RepID=A0ABW9XNE6_9BACL|nr:ABC transporter substrate-binding protein [Paenibacillus glycinis]NBD24144.1 extracellular solute-binding protein [Paenibacillus glycinis]
MNRVEAKTRIPLASGVLLLGVLLSACGNNAADSANAGNAAQSAPENSAKNGAADPAANGASNGATNAAAGGAANAGESTPQTGGKLVIYSPNETEINNPILKEFQDRTGIQVEMVSGGTGDLLNRIKAEAANPLGDLMFGGTVESLDAYKEFFEPYESKELANLNPQMTDPARGWTPFTSLPMVILYNKDLVPAGKEPKSWNDLLSPDWKGKIAYADPAKSGSSFTQLATMLTAFGKDDGKGWDFVGKLIGNLDGKVLSSSGMVPKGVADKEYPVGITLEENALRYVEGGSKVGIVYPSEGTSAVPDGMAVIKGAKNADNAKLFIDFAAGKDVQSLMQSEFKRRPVRTDLEPSQGVTPISDIKLVNYDLSWASEQRAAIIDQFTKKLTGQQ